MKTQVVIISGKQGSGKSTVANLLRDKLNSSDSYYVKILKCADPIYEMHDAIANIMIRFCFRTPIKDGLLLQWLGTEYGRVRYGEDVWVKILKQRVSVFLNRSHSEGRIVIVDDCRFPNELAAFPRALKVRLECSQKIRKARCSSWRKDVKHPSETALDNSLKKFDRVYNSGVLTAEEIAKDIERLVTG